MNLGRWIGEVMPTTERTLVSPHSFFTNNAPVSTRCLMQCNASNARVSWTRLLIARERPLGPMCYPIHEIPVKSLMSSMLSCVCRSWIMLSRGCKLEGIDYLDDI